MKDFAILIGHTEDSKGAVSPFGVPAEFDFNSKVASFMEDICDVYTHESYKPGYTTMVKKTAAKINKHKYKAILVLHYNSFNLSSNGTEILYYATSVAGKKMASILSARIAIAFKTSNRGPKPITSSQDRGFAEVYYTVAPTVIVEPFFGSNKEDSEKFKNKEHIYAEVLKKFLKEL